jgi:hypothetical protein
VVAGSDMMKYEFVTRSIPTLWKGCYLLLARALPPVVFMAQPLRSVRCFMASYHGFLASYHGIPIRLNSRHKKSKACSWSVKLSGCYAAKGTLLQRCVMSVIEGLLPA